MVFIESQPFTRRLHHLAGALADFVLVGIQRDLLRDPQKGVVIKGLGGIRKARAANPGRGKGKRGGYRYLYLFLEHRNHIHLLHLLDKNEQEDLSSKEREILRRMVRDLRNT